MRQHYDAGVQFYKSLGASGESLNELKANYFMAQTGLLHPRDAERAYLIQQGADPDESSVAALWRSYLSRSGYVGTIEDMLYAFYVRGSMPTNKAVSLVEASSQKGTTAGNVSIPDTFTVTFFFKYTSSIFGFNRGIYSNRVSSGFLLGIQNNALFFFGNGFGAGGSTGSLNDDVWRHAAFVGDGANGLTMYLNGSSDGSGAGTVLAANHPISVGYDSPNNTYFGGDIDELCVFNYAMSPAEVAADYNAGDGVYHTADTPGLIAGYHFDDDGADILSTNDLTLDNSPSFIDGIVQG